MSTPTLVFRRSGAIGSRQFGCGDELPPNVLSPEVIAHWLDEDWIRECDSAERPSLYRLFYRFSGCKEEQPLTKEQIARYALDE